jgi:hypothetical protein
MILARHLGAPHPSGGEPTPLHADDSATLPGNPNLPVQETWGVRGHGCRPIPGRRILLALTRPRGAGFPQAVCRKLDPISMESPFAF